MEMIVWQQKMIRAAGVTLTVRSMTQREPCWTLTLMSCHPDAAAQRRGGVAVLKQK